MQWDFQATAGMPPGEESTFYEQWHGNWHSFNARADAPADRTPRPSTHKSGKMERPQDPHKTTKPIRLCALGLLRGLDHVLGMCGAPLSSFLTDEAMDEVQQAKAEAAVRKATRTRAAPEQLVAPKPQPLRFLVLHSDEGSSNLAAVNHLMRRTRVLLQRDPAHREWNDIRNAIKQCNCNSLVLMLTFTFNTPYGPWEGAKWHKSNKLACDVINELGPADPLVICLQDWIRLDKGTEHQYGNLYAADNRMETDLVLDPQDFKFKGKKISLTRWFDFFGRLEEKLPCWHSLYLVMLFQGIATGAITTREDFPTLVRRHANATAGEMEVPDQEDDGPPAPKGTAADMPKIPTARDSVNALRQKCPGLSCGDASTQQS